MHCQRAHARWLVEQQGAEDLFIAKDNQPHLVETISRVPEQAFSPPDTTVDRGHGRVGCRTVRAAPAGDGVDFPGVRQVMEILRHTTDLDGSNPTTVEYGVTSLDAARADPARLGVLAPGHWSIEALHHVRDVTFAEDASRVRTRNGPQIRAALHNTGIGCCAWPATPTSRPRPAGCTATPSGRWPCWACRHGRVACRSVAGVAGMPYATTPAGPPSPPSPARCRLAPPRRPRRRNAPSPPRTILHRQPA